MPYSWYWLFRETWCHHYQGWWKRAQCDDEMKWKTVPAGLHYTISPCTSSGYDLPYMWHRACAISLALTTSAATCTQFLEPCRWKEHVPPKLWCLDASIHGVKTIISQTEIYRLYGNPMSIAKSTKAHRWILLHPVQSIPRFHGVFLQQIMLILLFRVRLYLQNGLFL